MATQFQPSSFIPKKPLTKAQPQKQKQAVGISTVIGGIIFVVSIGLAVGVYFYEQNVMQELETKKAALDRSQEAFDPNLIKELSMLDVRISGAESLLEDHLALTPLYAHLEELTLQSVRFIDFSYSRPTGPFVEVFMNGEAESFTAIALQADSFSGSPVVQAPLFTSFSLGTEGLIGFQVRLLVSRDFLNYANTLE